MDTDPERVEQHMDDGVSSTPFRVAILFPSDPWVVTHGYSNSSPQGMGNAAQLHNFNANRARGGPGVGPGERVIDVELRLRCLWLQPQRGEIFIVMA